MKEIFSRRLKELVGDRPVTEFSRFVGIPQATIDRYLKKIRSPSGEYVARISTVTGVSADWLLGLSDQRAALRPAEYPLHAADPPARVAEGPPHACPCCADKDRQIERLMRVVENLSLGLTPPSPSVYFGDGQACLVIFAPH